MTISPHTFTPTSMMHSTRPPAHRTRRPLRIYSESLADLSADYAQLTLRLIELDVTSIQSMQAIDQLMSRLRPYTREPQHRAREQECPA